MPLSSFRIATELLPSGTGIKITDLSSYGADRAKYVLATFISTDEFIANAIQDFENFMSSEWIVPISSTGAHTITVMAVPIWTAGTYATGSVFFTNDISGGFNVNKIIWKSLVDNNVTVPSEGANWTQVVTTTAALINYATLQASVLYSDTSVEISAAIDFSVHKTDLHTYSVLSTVVSGVLSLFTYSDYINERPAILTANIVSGIPYELVTPTDGIFIAAISNNAVDYSYVVIYDFDGMRAIIKALIKKIFCPVCMSDCEAEYLNQLLEDRLFITKVSTAMAVLIGIIHSERTDHFHYFSMTEARLAALQRANDILEKVIVLFGAYNYDLTCNCHQS